MTLNRSSRNAARKWLPLAALATSILATPDPGYADGAVRYENGRWFDGERFVDRVVYSVEGILASSVAGSIDRMVDLEGGYVIPALGNAHTHALADGGYEQQIAEFPRRGVLFTANPNNLPRLTRPVRPSVNVPGSVEVIYSNGCITSPGGHPIQIYDSIADSTPGWSREDMVDQAYHVVDSAEDLERVWPLIEAGGPDFTSHRSTADVPDVETVHQSNLRLLRKHRVPLVVGTDSHRSLLDEIDEVARLGGFSAAEMLRMATRDTPRWILPGRPIGELGDGQEATFLVLESDPLDDLANLRGIRRRVQRGHELETEAPAEEKPSIAQPMAHEMMANGLEAALALYHRNRREEPDAWDFAEQQLNGLGYQVMQHGMTDEAIRVFELNVEQFPESSNVYDSLGESLMKAGRLDEAIYNYERSLELNPHNGNAREKIEEIEQMHSL